MNVLTMLLATFVQSSWFTLRFTSNSSQTVFNIKILFNDYFPTAVIRYDRLLVYLTPSSVLSKWSSIWLSNSPLASTFLSFVSSSFQFRHHHHDHRLSDPEWFGAFYNLLPQTRSTLICVPLVFALNALHTWNRMVCLQFHFQTYQILWTYLLWLIC